MTLHIRTFFGTLLIAAFALISGWATVLLGYWLSDIMYDVGLWPIGAVMRVVLIIGHLLS